MAPLLEHPPEQVAGYIAAADAALIEDADLIAPRGGTDDEPVVSR
jgi:hypothetical protein